MENYKKLTINEIYDLYNNDQIEYLSDDGEFLKYGCHSIEEFLHWLKENNYEFIKK